MIMINNPTYWFFFTCYLKKLFHLNYAVREQYFMIHAYSSQAPLSAGIMKGKSVQLPRLSQSTSSTQSLKLLLTPLSRNTAQSIHSNELLKQMKAKKKQLYHFTRKTRWQKTHKAIGYIRAKPKRETKRELRSPQLLSLVQSFSFKLVFSILYQLWH